MKSLSGARRSPARMLTALLVLTVGPALANTTNQISYIRSFEDPPYSDGAVIVDQFGAGTDGWYGSGAATAAQATAYATNYPFGGTLPIPEANHTIVLGFGGTISNVFKTSHYVDTNNLLTNVVIDCMLQAGYLDHNPSVGSDVQMAVYVTNSGHLVVWHSYYRDASFVSDRVWTELDHPVLLSNDWFRLTVTMDYLTSGPYYETEHFFKVQLNSGAAITSAAAYKSPIISIDPLSDMGGPWFKCANADAFVKSPAYFSGLGLNGRGSMDDLKVTADIPPKTGLEAWLEDQGLPRDGDFDGDGAENWEEYYGGTDPKSKESALRVLALASNYLTWYGTTNWGSYGPYGDFVIYRSTNLVKSGGGWVPVSTNPRSPDGTNTWWSDLKPAATPSIFYQPRAPIR